MIFTDKKMDTFLDKKKVRTKDDLKLDDVVRFCKKYVVKKDN